MPYRKLFLSRWAALLWAAGILWTAVDFVGFAPPPKHQDSVTANQTDATDATGAAVDDADLATLANVMKGN